MDVEDTLGPARGEIGAEDAHVARKDDEFDSPLLQQCGNTRFRRFLRAELPRRDDGGLNPGAAGALEREGVRAAGDDEDDLAAPEYAAALRVDERLQIRPAAGDEYGDPGLQHRITPLSAEAISPMT